MTTFDPTKIHPTAEPYLYIDPEGAFMHIEPPRPPLSMCLALVVAGVIIGVLLMANVSDIRGVSTDTLKGLAMVGLVCVGFGAVMMALYAVGATAYYLVVKPLLFIGRLLARLAWKAFEE